MGQGPELIVLAETVGVALLEEFGDDALAAVVSLFESRPAEEITPAQRQALEVERQRRIADLRQCRAELLAERKRTRTRRIALGAVGAGLLLWGLR